MVSKLHPSCDECTLASERMLSTSRLPGKRDTWSHDEGCWPWHGRRVVGIESHELKVIESHLNVPCEYQTTVFDEYVSWIG